jgi:hypothetical protein
LFSSERLTDVVDHWPSCCSWGHVFAAEDHAPAGAPARHQVAELPPLAVEISEHRLRRVCCPDFGRTVRVELPAASVPRGCFGPKPEAAIAALSVRNRLSVSRADQRAVVAVARTGLGRETAAAHARLAKNLLKLWPRSGPSPTSPMLSRRTTPPSAVCAPPSSCCCLPDRAKLRK